MQTWSLLESEILLLAIEHWPCERVEDGVHDQGLDAEHRLLQLPHHSLHPGLKVRLVWREAHACVVKNHLEKGLPQYEIFSHLCDKESWRPSLVGFSRTSLTSDFFSGLVDLTHLNFLLLPAFGFLLCLLSSSQTLADRVLDGCH